MNPPFFSKSVLFKPASLVLFALVMMNLNAVVDYFLHPDIPYFDEEHLIVGIITGCVSMIGFGLLLLYARSLEKALTKIKTLESVLPMCSFCKKIRKPDSNPEGKESWLELDVYLAKKTRTQLSHTVCPECAARYYADYVEDPQ